MDKSEVFSKADLSELPKSKTKKKREHATKVKSKPNAKRQKDNVQPLNLRPKHQLPGASALANQENRIMAVGLGRTKNQLFYAGNNRLRTLHSSKAKVSDTVTSRKVLGELQSNVISTNQLQHDLQRVLGKGSESGTTHHNPGNPETKEADTSGADMDCSPAVKDSASQNPSDPAVPLVEIGCRLVEGLQVDVIFPHSSYLDNTKAELKKVLKQSNPLGYKELIRYFSSEAAMPSPFISQLQHTQMPLVRLNLPSETSEPEHEMRPGEPTLDPHTCPAPPQPHLPVGTEASRVMHGNDAIALNLEVNTSALNISDGSSDHTPRPKDFLDLMDSVTGPTHHATPPDWTGSPSRPRMFPHKLY